MRLLRFLAPPVAAALLFTACSSGVEVGTGGGGSASTETTTATSAATGDATTASSTGGFMTGSGGFMQIPVKMIPGLVSITYYERSGGTEPTSYTYSVDGPEMNTYIPALSDAAFDIKGVNTEFYDVYYSDADGNFDVDGSYLTISGEFGHALPAGGGLNLAEIGLNYVNAPVEYGNYVASFVVLGDNGVATTVPYAIDGDLQTNTTMGNTIGQTERLRVTLGFESSSGPPQ